MMPMNQALENVWEWKNTYIMMTHNHLPIVTAKGKSVLAYLEMIDQVISGEQVIEDKFQCVVSTSIIQCKHIKGPHIHMLEQIHTNKFLLACEYQHTCSLIYNKLSLYTDKHKYTH